MQNVTPPSDSQRRLPRRDRVRAVLARIRTDPSVRMTTLAEDFGVSAETIRRDLERLSAEGLVRRTLGGAIASTEVKDPEFNIRMRENAARRERVAQAAQASILPGDVLFISSGITALQFAQCLSTRDMSLTVISASVRVANAMAANSSAQVLLAPGQFDAGEQAVSGPETQSFLSKFHADRVVFGASGVAAEGVTEARTAVAWNLRAMIAQADEAILLADSSLFGRTKLERVAPLSAVDLLVTDAAPDGDLSEALAAAGTRILVAED